MVIIKNRLHLVCICRKCDIITAKYTFPRLKGRTRIQRQTVLISFILFYKRFPPLSFIQNNKDIQKKVIYKPKMKAICQLYVQPIDIRPPIFYSCFSLKVMCIADKKRKPVLRLYAVYVCNTHVYLYSGLTKMAERQLQFLHNLALEQLSKKKPKRFSLLKKVCRFR